MFPFRLPENTTAPTQEPVAPAVAETPGAAPVMTPAPRALEPLDA